MKQNTISPLNFIRKFYLQLVELAKVDSEQYLSNQVLLHPDYAFVVDFLLDKPLPILDYQLLDEVKYQQQLKMDAFADIFYDLSRTTDLLVVCVSNFQYASNDVLNFFMRIIKDLHNGNQFLFFSSFVPFGSDKFKEQDDIWASWSWELECRGKLIHVPLNRISNARTVWPSIQNDNFADLSVREKLDLAQKLMDMLCLTEAYTLLKDIYENVSSLYSVQIKNRVTLLYGRSLLFLNRSEEAMISFDRLGDLGHVHNDERLLCIANLEMAYTSVYRNDYKLAKRYISYCQKFSQTINSEELLLQVTYCEFLVYDAASSAYSYDKIKYLIEKLKLYNKEKELVNVLARTYSQEPSNPQTLTNDMCIKYINEAIDIARKKNFKFELAVAYQALGVVNVKRNNIDEAIKYLKNSEDLRSKMDIPAEQARIQNGIGYLYCLKGNFKDSLSYYVEAMRSVINTNVVSEITSALYNMAWVYFLKGSYENSLKVLETLWEILKIKDTKYFPFRNIHDVFILQGFNYYFSGHCVHASRSVRNSQNLDIDISDQGSMLRPLLTALINLNSGKFNNVWSCIDEAHLYLNKNLSQLSILHEILFHSCLTYIYRKTEKIELAFAELKIAMKLCTKQNFTTLSVKKLRAAWNGKFYRAETEANLPEAELKQCLYMVKQEQTMSDLWNQVNGMRLCSLLQKLTSTSSDLKYISSETLRLICMHFNVQGGFIYIKNDSGDSEILSTYSQWKNLEYSYESFADFIAKNQNNKQIIYNKVTIGQSFFSSVMLLRLLDNNKIIGHIVLTTYVGDFITDSNEMETITFITNQFASRVVNLRQSDQLLKISTHDQLTGLKNRQYFQKLVFDIKSYSNTVLVFIDLDNFKNYNDTYGHNVGDNLLVWFSEILVSRENKRCKVCRWGGDEFLLLFTDTTEKEAFEEVSALRNELKGRKGFVYELENMLQEKISLPENKYLDFSAGLCYAKIEDENVSGKEMLHLADNFLYEVKKTGKGHIKSVHYSSK